MPLDDTIQQLIQKSTNRALCQWLHCGCSFGPICIRASFSPAVGQCKPPSPSFSFTNQSNFGRGQSHWGCSWRCTKIGVRIKLIKCWEISVSIWRKSNLYLVNIFSDINKIWKLISIVYHINLEFFFYGQKQASKNFFSYLPNSSWPPPSLICCEMPGHTFFQEIWVSQVFLLWLFLFLFAGLSLTTILDIMWNGTKSLLFRKHADLGFKIFSILALRHPSWFGQKCWRVFRWKEQPLQERWKEW